MTFCRFCDDDVPFGQNEKTFRENAIFHFVSDSSLTEKGMCHFHCVRYKVFRDHPIFVRSPGAFLNLYAMGEWGFGIQISDF